MKILFFMVSLLITNCYADESAALKTLKDNSALIGLSPQPVIKRWEDTQPIQRNYDKQPPIIPHTTKGYVINLKFNKCLTCHSDVDSKLSGAPPVGMSHYTDREGNFTQKIAGRRYFCVQCHVPQMETEPLMNNDFKPAEGAK
jgi:cytochrome c-type protein NapB